MQARMKQSGIYLEDLCYQAQQAAEKAMKGLLLHAGCEFPYTHDLSRLIALLEATDIRVPEEIKKSTILSQYAYTTRYPGSVEPVSESEYEESLVYATHVVGWAETLIAQSSDPETDKAAES